MSQKGRLTGAGKAPVKIPANEPLRHICRACDIAVGDRYFTVEPIIGQKYYLCDTCYRLVRLGVIEDDGTLLVERRGYDEEGMLS